MRRQGSSVGGLFGLSNTQRTYKSFSARIKFLNTCLVSGDMSTPHDPAVLKSDHHGVLTVCGHIPVHVF